MDNIKNLNNKLFTSLPDYDQELQKMCHKNVRQLHSKVTVEKCDTIDNIKKQVYLARIKKKSSFWEGLTNGH